jgi:exopolysaccharide production protein ExoZ
MPLYWVATASHVGYFYFRWDIHPDSLFLFRSIFLLSDFNYWSPIIQQGWSLAYEIVFYFIFGVLLLAFRKNVPLWCALVFAFLVAVPIPVPGLPGQHFRWDILIEFAFGLLLAQSIIKGRRVKTNRMFGIGCIVAAFVIFALNPMPPQSRALGWGIPSLLFLYGIIQFEGASILRNRSILMLGAASYSIYLFHLLAMAILRDAAARYLGFEMNQNPIAGSIALVLFGAAFGVLVHVSVERGLLKMLRRIVLLCFAKDPERDVVAQVALTS